MGELVVNEWKRYGNYRLYVNTADEHRVGWVDMKTGARMLDRPDLAADFEAAIAPYGVALGETAAGVGRHRSPQIERNDASSADPDPAAAHHLPERTPPVVAAEYDLACRRPGASLRELAESELEEMKAQSRVGTFLARALDKKTQERAWRVGADGEETVGARLERLTSHGWHVLHSVPVGKGDSDIDHVLIGPGGVYSINTKNHPGKKIWVSERQIRVDGHPEPYLRNSRFEGDRSTKLLSEAAGFPVFVLPALVLLTGTLVSNFTIRQRPDDVLILGRSDVPRVFRKAPTRLSPEHVEWIFSVARRNTTWQSR